MARFFSPRSPLRAGTFRRQAGATNKIAKRGRGLAYPLVRNRFRLNLKTRGRPAAEEDSRRTGSGCSSRVQLS